MPAKFSIKGSKSRSQILTTNLLFLFLASCTMLELQGFCQVLPPDREYLFLADKLKKTTTKQKKKELAQKRSQAASSKITKGASLPFDISASTLDFDTSGSVLKAAGSVIISYSTLIAEASEATVNTVTNEAILTKDVRISDINANLTAQNAQVNLASGQSRLDDVSLFFAEGNYSVQAKQATRNSKDEYNLKDAVMTTCSCPEGEDCRPWSISSKETSIERDGYGEAWWSSLRVYDVPVFYLPYFFFPAKTERQSGFLPATFGIGRRNGFIFNLPFFWDIDDSTDLTITTLYESRVRIGGQIDGRKAISRNHTLEFGGLYLDENARGGAPLGTRLDGLADRTIGTYRSAGYLNELWNTKIYSQPFQWIVDAHYVSDDLIPREIQNSRIADQNSRFVTSSATLRTPIGDSLSLDVYNEFNQSVATTDDDRIFQRLPQISLTGMDFYRPFGNNPYGLRMVLSHSAESTNFVRKVDYSGARNELNEKVTMPFFFGNYLEGSLNSGIRATSYSLTSSDNVDLNGNNVDVDNSKKPLPASSDRLVPTVGGRVGNVFEGIYDVGPGNPLKLIGELGTLGKTQSMERVKHTFEPGVSYLYVPDVDQLDNPQFDSQDRLAQRNVVTYSLTQRLYARYKPRNNYLYGVEEAAPRIRDLGGLMNSGPLSPQTQFGVDPSAVSDYASITRGEIDELVTLRVTQSYNLNDPEEDINPALTRRLSDIGTDLMLYPNEYIRFRGHTDFNEQESTFNAYLLESQLSNKRGDMLRTRLRFNNNSLRQGSVEDLRQIESSLEFGVTDRVRLGYYSRWDDIDKKFREQRAGVRLLSSCNCWMVDFLASDQTNPDNTRLSFNVTLLGLGQIGNSFFTSVQGNNANTPAIGQ